MKKKKTLQEEIQELHKLTQEHLQASRRRLEETKRLLESTNRQFFNESTNKVSFEHLKTLGYGVEVYDNKTLYFSLTKKRISIIPKRDIDWFKHQYRLFAYSTDAKKVVDVSVPVLGRHDAVLFQLQAKGFRFIESSNEGYLAVAKDCQTCRFADKCPLAMKTATMCPATEKIEQGFTEYSISKKAFDSLIEINCIN